MTISHVIQSLLDNGSTTYCLQGSYQQILAAIKELEELENKNANLECDMTNSHQCSTVWSMNYGINGQILFATKEQAMAINKSASTYVEPCEIPVIGSKPDMATAYNGAREDVEIWKKRALEAEAKLRKIDSSNINDSDAVKMFHNICNRANVRPDQYPPETWFILGCTSGHTFIKEYANES